MTTPLFYEMAEERNNIFRDCIRRQREMPPNFIMTNHLAGLEVEGHTKLRLLVIRRNGLGDVIMSTAVVRGLYNKYKAYGVEIDVHMGEYNDVYRFNPYVNQCLVNPPTEEDKQHYHGVVNLDWFVDQYTPNRHRIDEFCELAGLCPIDGDIPKEERYLDYFLGTHELGYNQCDITLVWSSSTMTRSLSYNKNIEILDILTTEGFKIAILGAKEITLPSHLEKHELIHNTTGQTTIREAAHIMNNTKIVLSPDTGFFHLASALKKPIITYFGVFPSPKYMTSTPTTDISEKHCPIDCQPCMRFNCPIILTDDQDTMNPCVNFDPKVKLLPAIYGILKL